MLCYAHGVNFHKIMIMPPFNGLNISPAEIFGIKGGHQVLVQFSASIYIYCVNIYRKCTSITEKTS